MKGGVSFLVTDHDQPARVVTKRTRGNGNGSPSSKTITVALAKVGTFFYKGTTIIMVGLPDTYNFVRLAGRIK